MQLKVITTNKIVFSDDVDELIIDTITGQLGILPHHMPIVTSIMPGEMIMKIKGKEKYFGVNGGFLEVNDEGVTILSDYAVYSEDIEIEKAMAAKKRAEEILKKSKEGVSEQDFANAQADLRRAVMELHVANRRRRERSVTPQNR